MVVMFHLRNLIKAKHKIKDLTWHKIYINL